MPLSHVATLAPGKGPEQIQRVDRFRTIGITADVDKQSSNVTVLQRQIGTYLDALMARYPGVSCEMEGEAREQREAVASLQIGMIVVLFVIYGMLALPLKSYSQPLVIMSVIPFGLIGTAITLVLVPANILILHDLKERLYRATGWNMQADSAVAAPTH